MDYNDNGMSLRDISTEYDNIYDEMQALLDKHTPCKGFNGEPCRVGSFCCNGCRHLSDNGCTVKAMWCKFWLCSVAGKYVNMEFVKARDALKIRFRMLPFAYYIDGRYSKEQYLTAVSRYRLKHKKAPRCMTIQSDAKSDDIEF